MNFLHAAINLHASDTCTFTLIGQATHRDALDLRQQVSKSSDIPAKIDINCIVRNLA